MVCQIIDACVYVYAYEPFLCVQYATVCYACRVNHASGTESKQNRLDSVALLLNPKHILRVNPSHKRLQNTVTQARSHEQLSNSSADCQYRRLGETGTALDCDFCVAKCERINNLSITLLEVPSYVCEGHIELGLKGQRDTAMQSEQNKTVPVVPDVRY